jgi:hypothetical protein
LLAGGRCSEVAVNSGLTVFKLFLNSIFGDASLKFGDE